MGKRFSTDFAVPHTADLVKFIAEDFFDKEGFKLTDYHGEAVWKKGIGMLAAPQFIKLSYQNGWIHLEAWIKFAILPGVYCGEMGLDGFWGFAIKDALRGKVNTLISLLCQPSVQPQPPVTSFSAPVQEKKEVTIPPQATVEASPAFSESVQTYPQPSPVTPSSVVSDPIPSGQTVQVTPVSSNPPVMPSASPQEIIPQNISGTAPYQQPFPPTQGVPIGCQPPVGYPVAVHNPTGPAILSLVMGLVSIVTFFIPIIGLAIPIIGLASAPRGMKSTSKNCAIAGMILSIIFLCFSGFYHLGLLLSLFTL